MSYGEEHISFVLDCNIVSNIQTYAVYPLKNSCLLANVVFMGPIHHILDTLPAFLKSKL